MKKLSIALILAIVSCSLAFAPAFAADGGRKDFPHKNGEMRKDDHKRPGDRDRDDKRPGDRDHDGKDRDRDNKHRGDRR